jgi:predicted GH43/DUF377 family glycosyl hydrolase
MPNASLQTNRSFSYPAMASAGLADFVIEALEPVSIAGPAALLERTLISPYVWPDRDGTYRLLVGAVPPKGLRTDTGEIWAGRSDDGLAFVMADAPCLVAGPSTEDCGGVEDPSVHLCRNGDYLVYYTGIHGHRHRGRLLAAQGKDLGALRKIGPAMPVEPGGGSTKAASLFCAGSKSWRLFYEYADDHASRIGLAAASGPRGPWTLRPSPLRPRENCWDRWHLSTGPIVSPPSDFPVMFYNGATEDGRWRIGWALLDSHGDRVIDRCVEPLLTPPPVKDRSATDIAFAASAFTQGDLIWLYYALEDRRPMRALIRRIPGRNAH